MGVVNQIGGWLGIGRHHVVAGITLGGDHLVMTALRPDPIRMVGLARCPIGDGAVVDGDVRLPQRVAERLTEMRSALRLSADTKCVVSVEPLYSNVQIGGPAAQDPTIAVSHRSYDRAGFVAIAAGFRPQRIDVRPAALARVALAEHDTSAAVRTADGWTIVAYHGKLDGSRRSPASVRSVQLGPDLGTTASCDGLASVAVPARLREALDLDYDIEAIGAALAALGHPPLVTAVPTTPPNEGGEWTVESVPVTRIPPERERRSPPLIRVTPTSAPIQGFDR